MLRSRVLRATTGPGIQSFPTNPRLPRPPKNPLLPPLQLYRNILRIHRKMPVELRQIGDPYVKSEFKLHKTTENPMHIVGFLSEWQKYAQDLSAQSGAGWQGAKIDKTKIDKMSDEQLTQLYDLMNATKEINEDIKATEEANSLIDKITQK